MNVVRSVRRDLEQTGAAGIALLILFLGVATNRYRFEFVPLRPQPEHFALVIAGGILAWLLLRRRVALTWQWSDVLLGLYLALALGASLVFPADPRESVQYWLRMALAVAVFFVTRWLIVPGTQAAVLRLAVKALLLFGVFEAILGIGAWFLYPLGFTLGVDEYPLGVRGPGGILCNFSLTTYGTLWEPNVYASALMTVILIGAALFVSNEFRAWHKPLGVSIGLMLAALALNASRGALGTLTLGLGLLVVIAPGMAFTSKLKWALAAAAIVLAVSIPSLEVSRALMQLPTAPGLAARAPCAAWIAEGMPRGTQAGDPALDPPTGPESGSNAVRRILEAQTLASRWESYRAAWNDFVARPLFGNGANSFGQTFTTTARTPGWISNAVLMSLHDTGIVGTAALLAWFLLFAARLWRAESRAPPGAAHTLLFALGIGLAALAIAYQVTTMLWFGFIWWCLAVAEAGVGLLRVQQTTREFGLENLRLRIGNENWH